MRSVPIVACGWLVLAACSQKESGAGESCVRSAQCARGLVCISGRCTDDLDLVVEQSEVPMVGPAPDEQAMDAAADGAATDAASDAMPSEPGDAAAGMMGDAAPPPADAAAGPGDAAP